MKVHIGEEIERRYQKSGMKISAFAKKLNTTPRNAYNIFKKESIQVDQLILIGEVLSPAITVTLEAGKKYYFAFTSDDMYGIYELTERSANQLLSKTVETPCN